MEVVGADILTLSQMFLSCFTVLINNMFLINNLKMTMWNFTFECECEFHIVDFTLFIRNILFINTVNTCEIFSLNDGIPSANVQMSSNR